MPVPSWIGQTIGGRYKIESLLGQGGMSAVYKGTDPNLRRPVAIKMIHSHMAADPQFVHRFEEEAAAVARLRHPNIIQVYDFNHDGDTYFMVLEFVPGESLFERLTQLHARGQRLAGGEAVRLISVICDAVQYAHDRQIIHRDLKPANVMINTAGQPILMDFGIAKIVGGAKNTATGALIGTPTYIAPEQVRGDQPDARADIYALGVMLYEMIAGRVPFDSDSALSIMLMHVNEPVPDIRQLNREVPEGLMAAINRALAKPPGDRFQSAREMAVALRPYLPPRERTQPGRAARQTVAASESRPTPPPGDRKTTYQASGDTLLEAPRRNLWPVLLGLAAVGLVGLLAAALLAAAVVSQYFPQTTATSIVFATQPGTPVVVGQTAQPTPEATAVPATTAAPVAPTDTPPPPPPTVGPTDIPIPDGMTLILAGPFQMGSDDRSDEQPIHPVLLDAFYLDTTEATNAQYRACVQSGTCSPANSGTVNSQAFGEHPVSGVTWNQSNVFCQAQGKRLPTEAEWEYAAGGPDHLRWPWGNDFDPDLSAASAPDLQPVGSYPGGASPFGILDMAGNVTEWVADLYSTDFYANSPLQNPVNTTAGAERIYRGGAFGNTDGIFYTTSRRWHRPFTFSDVDVGFRCAKNAPEVNAAIEQVDRDDMLSRFCALVAAYKPGAPCP